MQNKVDTKADPAATVLTFCPRAMRTNYKAYFCSDHPKEST